MSSAVDPFDFSFQSFNWLNIFLFNMITDRLLTEYSML